MMADQEDGQLVALPGFQDIVLEPEAHFVVQGGQGFVEEQESWFSGDGAGDGYALLLSAGQQGRVLVLQCFEVHEFQQLVYDLPIGVFGQCEFQLFADGHMGKEGEILEDEADGTVAGGKVDLFVAVEPGCVVDLDMAAVSFCQPGEDTQESGLTGPRGAAYGEYFTLFCFEGGVKPLRAAGGVEHFCRPELNHVWAVGHAMILDLLKR